MAQAAILRDYSEGASVARRLPMTAMLGLGEIYVSTLGLGDYQWHDRQLEPLGNWIGAMYKNGTMG